MTFFRRSFGSKTAPPLPLLKLEFDASVAQRLAAAGKDPNRIEAAPAELVARARATLQTHLGKDT